MTQSRTKLNVVFLSALMMLSMVAVGAVFAGPVAAQTVTTDEVDADGSTVTIETEGAASISVTNIEGGVSNIQGGSATDAGILFQSLGGLPDTVSFDLTPPAGQDTVSFDVDGETVELDVDTYDINLITEEVDADGSTVTIETDGVASISVTNIEGEVSSIEDGSATGEGILFSNLGGLPDTVSFDLTPPEGQDTVRFDVDGETVELNVSTRIFEDRTFDRSQFTAVFGDDGDQTQDELSAAINEWFTSEDGTVNGVPLSQNELSDLINYWFEFR